MIANPGPIPLPGRQSPICQKRQPCAPAPPVYRKDGTVRMVSLYRRLLPKTNVFTLAELLAEFGSKLGELTTAVFVIDAGTGGIETRTVKLTVTDAPLGMLPKLQVTVPPFAGAGVVQEAPPEFIDRKMACAGTGSVKVTAEASNGPRFVTVTV